MLFSVLVLAANSAPAVAQDSTALPPAIKTTFRHAYPHAAILHVSRELRSGEVVYEVESQDGPMRRDLIYGLSGQPIEIEETIPADSLPQAVRTAVRRDAAGAVVIRVERVTHTAALSYEVQVRQSGRTRVLTYDAAGHRQQPGRKHRTGASWGAGGAAPPRARSSGGFRIRSADAPEPCAADPIVDLGAYSFEPGLEVRIVPHLVVDPRGGHVELFAFR